MGAEAVDRGSLRAIFDSDNPSGAVAQPVLQCVQVKAIAGQAGAPERYRVVFSDITNFVQSMLATQVNHVVHENKLRKGCFVRLKQFQANSVKGRRIIIVLDLDVLEELGESEKIGTPEALEVKDEEAKPTTISSGGFYGNQPQNGAKQQGRTPSTTTQVSNGTHANIYPIESLSPYAHKWTIKARVTSKSDIKTWHNKNGEGKLFSVNLLDESGEIKATGFKDQCDAFYDLFTEGNVYYISNCRVTLAKKQFSTLNNDYELHFERDSQIEKAEEQNDVPQIRYNFTSIGSLANIEKDAVVDTIGVLVDVGETSQIISKSTQRPYDKRELTIVDNSQYKIRLTIWGALATSFDAEPDSVVAFKGVKVSDFGGRSLSLLSSGTMSINPDIEEAFSLKGWFDAQDKSMDYLKHDAAASLGAASGQRDQTKTILQVKDENLGMSENPDYFNVKATVCYIKSDTFSYPACKSEGCNKKVIEQEPGNWRCEKCDRSHPEPEHRYIMSINVSDHTGQIWLSCFDDSGRLLMGRSANELVKLKEEDDKAAMDIFQEAMCQTFMFRCRAKMDSVGDTPRVRYQVTSATPLNCVTEATKLMKLIKMYD